MSVPSEKSDSADTVAAQVKCHPDDSRNDQGVKKLLDIGFVRSNFPSFDEPSLEGWAFFENAGGSYTCRQVIDRLTDYYLRSKVQPYHAYPTSAAAGEAMDTAYRRVGAWLNVSPGEVHIGPSTSQNIYVLANAFREMWQDGDEIVVSSQDHEANAGAWRRLAERGIVVKEWHVNPETGALNPDDLDELLTSRTKLLAFPHCSNVVAAINPVAELVARAHSVGAFVVVDGVSYAPHGLPDVAALGADVYLFSAYKTWGPHQGVMVVREHLLEQLGNQNHFFKADTPHYKLVPAGPDHAQVAAMSGVIEYLDEVYEHHFGDGGTPADRGRSVLELIRAYEIGLVTPLLDYLGGRDDVRLLGPPDAVSRAPTVSIVPRNRTLAEVQRVLTDHKLMTGTGNFYGHRPLQGMGISTETGVLRMSMIHYTTHQEVTRLIAGLEAALG